MRKNEIFDVECIDINNLGMGIARVDNFVLFIKNFIPGEKAKVVITKVNNKYGFAKILEFIKKSPNREDKLCMHYPACGGCQIMHLKYDKQLAFKKMHLEKLFNRKIRINGYNYLKYRNKVAIPFDGLKSGFYQTNSHKIVAIDNCALQSDKSNEIYNLLKKAIIKFNLTKVINIIIRESHFEKKLLLGISILGSELTNKEKFISYLISKSSDIKGILLIKHHSLKNNLISDDIELIYGKDYLYEYLLDIKYKLQINTFFQINRICFNGLLKKVRNTIEEFNNPKILDLYCGVGAISLICANKAEIVVGVELNSKSVEMARENARLNNIDNVKFICADASSFIKENKDKFDILIIDPPRKGLDIKTIDDIYKINPKKIIYVSCNPLTLKRDIEILKNKYKIDNIEGYDMFPNTYHVETVVLLSKTKA